MKHYKILIAYDGTRYSGWQVQKTTEDTIQGKIEHVLSTLAGHKVEIAGSGRTDAGVHAKGQVASFALEEHFDKEEILDAFAQFLPRDIAVYAIEEVDARFHARLSAKRKTYVYRIHTGAVPNVFERRFLYDYKAALDVAAMRRAADDLVGEHDFKSFCGNRHMKKSTVRTIYDISIVEANGEVTISYTGNGFLMNMVRILTGTLIEVGDGRRSPDSMPEVIAALNRDAAGYTAPAQGLYLESVEY